MSFTRKSFFAVLGVVALMAAVSAPGGPASASAAPAESPAADLARMAEEAGKVWDEQKQQLVAAWDCPGGSVCFYSGAAGTGRACTWTGADADWLAAPGACPWARTDSVESVRNNSFNGAFTGIRYYTRVNYQISAGCILPGTRGALERPALLRSHRWESGSCGIGHSVVTSG